MRHLLPFLHFIPIPFALSRSVVARSVVARSALAFVVLFAGLLRASPMVVPAHATENPKRPPVSYTKEVEPFLRSKCITCHSGTQPQGELSLETPDTLAKGGRQGPIVVPKKPEMSLLWLYLTAARQPKMPPNEKVDESQIAMIRRWITEGAIFDGKKDDGKKDNGKQPAKG